MLMTSAASAATYHATGIYADEGNRYDSNDNQAGRDNPSNALGADDNDFWSMGRGGIAVLEFNPPGLFNDAVMTIEETYNCNSVTQTGTCSNYPESADVWVYSGDAVAFAAYQDGTFGPNNETSYDFSTLLTDLNAGLTFLGNIGNGDAVDDNGGHTFDISGLAGQFLYVILQDTSGSNSPDGFDIKSVSVSAVPLPPAMILFGAALGLLGFAGRWKKKAS